MNPYDIKNVPLARPALEALVSYLETAPDGAGVARSAHAAGLAGGIVSALAEAGYGVFPLLGKAAWVWEPMISTHVPVCNWCGAPLADEQVAEGTCGNHA